VRSRRAAAAAIQEASVCRWDHAREGRGVDTDLQVLQIYKIRLMHFLMIHQK
jgi:hypothetical protein